MYEVTEEMIKALDPAYGQPYEEYMFKDHRMGDKYACAVATGEIVACEDVQNACKRYICNRFNPEYIFATPIVDNLHRYAHLGKFTTGLAVTAPMKVLGWISWIFNALGGFYAKSEDGVWEKLYSNALILCAKGNSKTFMSSLYSSFSMMMAETGIASYIVVASNEKQAQYVVNAARSAVKTMPNPIQNLFTPAKRALLADTTENELIGGPAEVSFVDGRRIAVGVYDEFAEADNPELFTNLNSSTLSSRSSQVICISTAGTNTQGIACQEADISRRINLGEVDNEKFFGVYYHVDGDLSNWRDFDNMIKANPSLGQAVSMSSMKSQHKTAVQKTDVEARGFIIKNCNIFIKDSMDAYIDAADIDRSRDSFNLEDMEGLPAFVSVDYSTAQDITSVAVMVPHVDGQMRIITKNFITRAAYNYATDEIRYVYDLAEESKIGFDESNLTIFGGARLNQTKIIEYIVDCMERFDIIDIGLDDTGLNADLLHDTIIEMAKARRKKGADLKVPKPENIRSLRQGFRLSVGIDIAKGLFADGMMKTSKYDKILPWCIDNTSMRVGEWGEYKLVKEKYIFKIDATVAMVQCCYMDSVEIDDDVPTPKVSSTAE